MLQQAFLRCSLFVALTTVAVSCSKPEAVTPTTPRPSDTVGTSYNSQGSIYDMDMSFKDQNERSVAWQSMKGKVRIMTMFFSHCPAACPILTEDIKKAVAQLPASMKDSIGIAMISFDSKRDTPPHLMQFYRDHSLDENWELLNGSPEDVRMAANLLNVEYKEWPSGDFTHQNLIFVVDRAGRIVLRREGLGKSPQEISSKVLSLLNGSGSVVSND